MRARWLSQRDRMFLQEIYFSAAELRFAASVWEWMWSMCSKSSGNKGEHDETIEVGDSSAESDASSVDSEGELLDDLELVLDQ